MIAVLGQGQNRQSLSRLSGSGDECADAAFERGYALFDGVIGWVHQAGIDIAKLAQPKQVSCVFGVFELIRGRLIDWHRARAGCWVRLRARVQGQSIKMELVSLDFAGR